jgi:galactokinase
VIIARYCLFYADKLLTLKADFGSKITLKPRLIMDMKETIQAKFKTLFGADGDMFASAGRINLIGEHTDYNGGYVFPGAIDKGIVAEIKINDTDKVRAYSIDYDEYVEFGLKEEDAPNQSWAKYIFGVCRETAKRGGKVSGFDTTFAGDVPLGAGLSSSAALESTYAFALNYLFSNGIDKFDLAKIGQSTEHNYCGVNCGIMDQFASVFGKAGSLIRLNCKTLEYKYFPFNPKGYKLVLLDSCVKHELASSAYNKRRKSCENAAAAIRKNHPEVEFLSDAKRVWLDEVREQIPEEDFLRAEYVIGEVQRVLDVCDALERDDYETVGEMMYQTHFGLSKLYEVSCEELDFLNKLARKCEVTGSRVMGGGFGGCTINLVKEELYQDFVDTAVEQFTAKFGHAPKVYDVVISDGARKL